MRRTVLIALVIGVLLALTILGTVASGCGGSKTKGGEDEIDISIPGGGGEKVDVGQVTKEDQIKFEYSNLGIFQDPDDAQTFHVVMQVTNTSDEYGAETYYTVISIKNGNQVVGNTSELCYWLAPGETQWVVSDISSATPTVDGAEVSFENSSNTKYDKNTWPVVELQNVNITQSYSVYEISGTFANVGPVGIGQAYFTLVCFDSANKPVGCAWGYSEGKIPVGGLSPLEDYLDGVPGARFEVSATATNSEF